MVVIIAEMLPIDLTSMTKFQGEQAVSSSIASIFTSFPKFLKIAVFPSWFVNVYVGCFVHILKSSKLVYLAEVLLQKMRS